MEYVYAALLLHKLQKDVSEENITSVVKASGTDVNEAQVKALVAALADVNIEDAIKAAPVAVAAAAAPAAGEAKAGGDDKKEAKAEKKDDGKSEEQAMEGLSSLFG
jgi:large subunit ribosomal protein L12